MGSQGFLKRILVIESMTPLSHFYAQGRVLVKKNRNSDLDYR